MNIQTFASGKQVYRAAALAIARKILAKPNLVLGLSAGKTPSLLYENLIALYRGKQISFAQVQTFNLDEFYGIEKSSPSSFDYYMQNTFLKLVDIPPQNIHSLNGAATNPQKECADYEEKIQAVGGIDLQILGLGSNAHIAFNEPGSPEDSRTRLVELDASTRLANQYLFASSEVPAQALSMGIATILEAKEIYLLALGKNKNSAVRKTLTSPPSIDYPASFLQKHPHVKAFFDEEAYTP